MAQAQAKEQVQEAAGHAQEQRKQQAGEAKEKAREQVNERSTQAGERVTTAAGDARSVAEETAQAGQGHPGALRRTGGGSRRAPWRLPEGGGRRSDPPRRGGPGAAPAVGRDRRRARRGLHGLALSQGVQQRALPQLDRVEPPGIAGWVLERPWQGSVAHAPQATGLSAPPLPDTGTGVGTPEVRHG